MTEYKFVDYRTVDEGTIAVITLNRPRQRNAQNRGLLVELDDAFMAAERDDTVRVVILQGAGPVFSAGHDLGSSDMHAERDGGGWPLKPATPGPDTHPSYSINGGMRSGQEKMMLQEWHYFYQNTKRWRDLRKITIASVQGSVVAAGLMLAWACDLIVAAEDTIFADVVGTRMGIMGVEYFAHPWEFGPRKAKELLLTGDALDADDAYQLGMVSKVFPPDRLEQDTLDFARRIAAMPTMTALLIKEAVNQTMDHQGFATSLASAFSLHEVNHAYWSQVTATGVTRGTEEFGVKPWSKAAPVVRAEKGTVRAESPATDEA